VLVLISEVVYIDFVLGVHMFSFVCDVIHVAQYATLWTYMHHITNS